MKSDYVEKNEADIDSIKIIINSNLSAGFIERETGVSRMTISNLRREKSQIDRIRLITAIKLTNLYRKLIARGDL
ncbi:hypothetical protein [Enterococcus sp. AZ102]|uniref:hypothetical protein n=1 Tax=unclassified Enterococcus TaxID=2608891 RepID=UPI003F281F93